METLPRLAAVLLALVCARAAGAQAISPDEGKSEIPSIQDNSFLMEEAYNQEEGIVQHINAFRSRPACRYSFQPATGGGISAPGASVSRPTSR